MSPTVSLAWYASNEKFFDVLKPAISNLKIRGSIGKVNNDRAVSAYMYMSRLQNLNEGIYFGNDMAQYTSLLETQQANPSATYEKSTQINLGADLGMFSNRLNATFDIWKDRRTGVYTHSLHIFIHVGIYYYLYARQEYRENGNQRFGR